MKCGSALSFWRLEGDGVVDPIIANRSQAGDLVFLREFAGDNGMGRVVLELDV